MKKHKTKIIIATCMAAVTAAAIGIASIPNLSCNVEQIIRATKDGVISFFSQGGYTAGTGSDLESLIEAAKNAGPDSPLGKVDEEGWMLIEETRTTTWDGVIITGKSYVKADECTF